MSPPQIDPDVPDRDSETELDENGYAGPSKTRVKKDMHELQDLGAAMLELPQAQLDDMEMDDQLRQALRELRRTTAHGARHRQVQYVGKLLRGVDTQAFRDAIEARRAGKALDALAQREMERWRERLLADDEQLTVWIKAYPASDAQEFRTLIRNARREVAASLAATPGSSAGQTKGRAYRKLFQNIRELMQA
jgi:ribosome-associated protein